MSPRLCMQRRETKVGLPAVWTQPFMSSSFSQWGLEIEADVDLEFSCNKFMYSLVLLYIHLFGFLEEEFTVRQDSKIWILCHGQVELSQCSLVIVIYGHRC